MTGHKPTVDIPCTIINDGKIIGKGGQGGSGLRIKNWPHPTASAYNSGYSTTNLGTGSDGGPAINVTSSGVTITNSSGAYICGGGVNGGAAHVEPANTASGGGGGAGGAEGVSGLAQILFQDNRGSRYCKSTTNGPDYATSNILFNNWNIWTTYVVGNGGSGGMFLHI